MIARKGAWLCEWGWRGSSGQLEARAADSEVECLFPLEVDVVLQLLLLLLAEAEEGDSLW